MSLRLTCAALAAGFCFLTASQAGAQTITVTNKTTPYRYESTGQTLISPHSDLMPLGVNLQDCRDNQLFRFALSMTGIVAGDSIQVWATDQGADCGLSTSRTGTIVTCYQLPVVIAPVASTSVDIYIKDLIKGIPGSGTVIDADGCRRLSANTSIDVQFLYFRGSTTGSQTAKDDSPIAVKTQGPTPLTGLSLQPGNGHLTVKFDAVGEGGVADVTKAYAYCDRNPVASTAGTTTVCDASVDETGDASDAGCTQASTTAGSIPAPSGIGSDGVVCGNQAFAQTNGVRITPSTAFDSMYRCGQAGGTTATSILTDSVTNNTTVAVAVAGVDSFGNIGELSDAYCQYGEETSDFWARYRGEGGESGGGFCSVNGPGMPATSFVALGITGFVAVSIVRKKKKGKSGR